MRANDPPVPASARRTSRRVVLPLRAREGETLDSIAGGRVQILQRAEGYRFNIDPILLAHFAATSPGAGQGRAIDLGTGCGIIPLLLARQFDRRDLTGLEVQPPLFQLAERNVKLNRCERRVSLALADLRQVRTLLPAGGYAEVLSNPPYRAASAGRINPEEEKAIARHELMCSLDDVLQASLHLLRDRGSLFVVFPSTRLAQLMHRLGEHRLSPKRLRVVHPRAGRAAKLVLVQAIKHGRAELEVLAPLVLHEGTGFTSEVAAMLDGPTPEDKRGRVRRQLASS